MPPFGIPEKTVSLNPGTARRFARDFGYADRRLNQDIAFRYRAASARNIGANWPKSMEQVREALQKLNVFASSPSRHIYFGISEIIVGKQVEQEYFASVLSLTRSVGLRVRDRRPGAIEPAGNLCRLRYRCGLHEPQRTRARREGE